MADKVSAIELLKEMRALRDDIQQLRELVSVNEKHIAQDAVSKSIIDAAILFGIPASSITSESRVATTCNARALAAWILVRHYHYAVSAVGYALNRDHSSISHSVSKVDQWQGVLANIRTIMLHKAQSQNDSSDALESIEDVI